MISSLSQILDYPQVYRMDFRIRSYEIDFRGSLNPVILCFMLQEVASSHASSVSADITDLMKENKTWMLSRLKVEIKKYPKWKDKIRVYTWPVGIYRLFAIRDFLVTNLNGDILAASTSSWLVINLNRRKPVRVNDYLKEKYLLPDARAIDEFIDKPKFPTIEFKKSGNDSVKLGDIDINDHMTSMKYIEKIINNFDENIQKLKQLSEILIYFNSEALLKDNLVVEIAEWMKDNNFFHRIVRSSDNRELCIARTKWKNYD